MQLEIFIILGSSIALSRFDFLNKDLFNRRHNDWESICNLHVPFTSPRHVLESIVLVTLENE